MNELFWPSQTSEASGGSLVGTMSADRASGPQMPATYEQVLPVQSQEPQATPDVAGLSRVQAQGLAQDGQQATFFNKLSFNQKTGEVNVSLDQSALAEVMGQLTDLKQMKMAAMARVAQLKQQEASGSPLIDALSTFAGNMAANDPKMPGWIRALGQTSLQMGPQGIRAKREAEEAKVAGLSKGIADMSVDIAKVEDDRYKATLSYLETQRKAVDAQAKESSDALIKWRREGRAQITATGGQYDAEGMAAELASKGVPPEQIDAQISSMERYAGEVRKHLAAVANAKDAKDRAKWQERLDLLEEREARIDERAAGLREDTFGWNVMKMSIPTKDDVAVVKNMADMDRLLDKAEAQLGKVPSKYRGGPISGWFRGKNPWRSGEDQAAFETSYKLTLKALEASGLKPISELEFAKQMGQMFNLESTWHQNMAIIKSMREQVRKGTADYLQMNPHRNWGTVAGVLPPALQAIVPDLERRRLELYATGAPQQPGVPRGVRLPPGVRLIPVEEE